MVQRFLLLTSEDQEVMERGGHRMEVWTSCCRTSQLSLCPHGSSLSSLCPPQGVGHNAHKKLRFLPGIVHIDGIYQLLLLLPPSLLPSSLVILLLSLSVSTEGGALGQSIEMRRKKTSDLQQMFRSTGFPFYIVPLEQVCAQPRFSFRTEPRLGFWYPV